MRVLVTGTDGYIGAVLGPMLMKRGHDVVGLDCGFYRSGWLFENGHDRPATLTRDIRDVTARDLAGFEAVVHLAELSNDPLAAHDPRTTFEINHRGSVAFARLAKAAGVNRFVYSSSCSVYGIAPDGQPCDERAATAPQTAYAECKLLVERDVAALADASFAPVFLRNGTAFGPSPRMRFDIVLNNLAGLAWTTGRIAMTSDGSPWRPLVHVEDICLAMALALEAPAEAVRGEVLNVGTDDQNYRVRQIAEIVAAAFPGCAISFGAPTGDNRSYRVSFAKIRERLPGFDCRWRAEDGARQLAVIFAGIAMTPEMFAFPAFTRVRELARLRDAGRLDRDLRWRDAAGGRSRAVSSRRAEGEGTLVDANLRSQVAGLVVDRERMAST